MNPKKIFSLCLAALTLATVLPIRAQNGEQTYDGAGMTIAIIDRGFEFSHETFTLTGAPYVTKETSDALIDKTGIDKLTVPETLYVSDKIPFAYDYGDNDADATHAVIGASGTNLISIAAGNGKSLESPQAGATGVAPEAQIFAMKVHSDKVGYVTASAMEAAINDAVALGADVILIGIVSMEGFDDKEAVEGVNLAIENAEANGVAVICSAGSAMTYGSDSVWEKEYEMSLIDAEAPDVGTIAWPGYLKTTVAVTSADANTLEAPCLMLADGTRVPYGDSSASYPTTAGGNDFDGFFNGKALEYVPVGGFGTPADFAAAGDLTGKLALVGRGEITFAEKAANAAAAGAIGLVVVDNQADKTAALNLRMDLTGATVPAVIISSENGALMRSAADKRVTLSDGDSVTVYTRKTPSISSNTTYGSTTELSLKPDVAAIGSYVDCATAGGEYTRISSSRGAAARVAGAYAVLKARITEKMPGASEVELMNMTRSLLVSSAEQMEYLSGTLYSPRIQGGGVIDLQAGLDASLVLTSDGLHKIELGEVSAPIFELRVSAHNLSDVSKTCTLDAIIGSDSYEVISFEELGVSEEGTPLNERLGLDASDEKAFIGHFTELGDAKIMLADFMYQLNRASENYEPHTFVLAPHSSRTFTLTVYIDEATYTRYRDTFTNGFFVEGYVRLTADGETASIPYLGFVGDYSAAPALDADVYSGEQYIYDATYLYRYLSAAKGERQKSVLGERTLGINRIYNENELIFSPVYDRENASVYLNLGLLRSVCDVRVSVRDGDGVLVREAALGDLMRTYKSSSTGALSSPQIFIWDGRAADNPAYIYPDGEYFVDITYRTVKGGGEESISYTLKLDATKPTVSSYDFFDADGRPMLSVSAEDAVGISRISVVDSLGVYAEQVSDAFFDVSTLTGKYIYVEAYDYAFNMTALRISNPYYSPES